MLKDNGDGTVTRTGLPAAAREALEMNRRAGGQRTIEDMNLRQLALQHAVTTHRDTVDEGQIVKAAEAYLAFLTGEKPGAQ